GYSYDLAGNRIGEQIDDSVTRSVYDATNHLTNQQPGGKLRVTGTTDKPATVTVQGNAATTTPDNRFAGSVDLSAGTNTFTVVATDASGNVATRSYQIAESGVTTRWRLTRTEA